LSIEKAPLQAISDFVHKNPQPAQPSGGCPQEISKQDNTGRFQQKFCKEYTENKLIFFI
jgi:hypothetical protein